MLIIITFLIMILKVVILEFSLRSKASVNAFQKKVTGFIL